MGTLITTTLRNMYNVWVRLNAVVFFGLTVIVGLSVLAAISMTGHSSRNKPVVERLELNTLRSLKSHGGVDRALLSFDIHANMNPALHWNIKQLFLYVVASYKTSSNSKNEIVLWDSIIEAINPDDWAIEADNMFVKYALVDQGNELRGKDIELQLRWDHMPLTGLLHIGEQNEATTTT